MSLSERELANLLYRDNIRLKHVSKPRFTDARAQRVEQQQHQNLEDTQALVHRLHTLRSFGSADADASTAAADKDKGDPVARMLASHIVLAGGQGRARARSWAGFGIWIGLFVLSVGIIFRFSTSHFTLLISECLRAYGFGIYLVLS